MTTLSYTVPVAGTTLNSVADPQLSTALNAILAWSGTIDATNITNTFAQSIAANTGTQTVKGAVNIATSQSTSSTTYTTLATPDQITGVVLPANGLINVWYQAIWQESVGSAGAAAIFVGANQLVIADPGFASPINAAQAFIGGTSNTAKNFPIATGPTGLYSLNAQSTATAYTGDVTTGQVAGGGFYLPSSALQGAGCCTIFAAAGTYTISIQFKASSGSVTVANRTLRVQAVSFS